MNQEKIISELQEIFRNTLNFPDLKLTKELSAEHIPAWDSLTHLILISEVESFFKIKFRLKELLSMKNVGEMIALIEQKTDS
jgi:acyl carrier protein